MYVAEGGCSAAVRQSSKGLLEPLPAEYRRDKIDLARCCNHLTTTANNCCLRIEFFGSTSAIPVVCKKKKLYMYKDQLRQSSLPSSVASHAHENDTAHSANENQRNTQVE